MFFPWRLNNPALAYDTSMSGDLHKFMHSHISNHFCEKVTDEIL